MLSSSKICHMAYFGGESFFDVRVHVRRVTKVISCAEIMGKKIV